MTSSEEAADHVRPAELVQLYKLYFKLVPLLGKDKGYKPACDWKPIYNNPAYWTAEKLIEQQSKFANVATIFGKTYAKDERGDLNLNGFDCDSKAVYDLVVIPLNKIDEVLQIYVRSTLQELLTKNEISDLDWDQTSLLDIFKQITVVVKTKKEIGFHVYWLSHKQHKSIKNENPDHEYEIKTDKSLGLSTLPPSEHRTDSSFKYYYIGRTDKIATSDTLYDLLVKLFDHITLKDKSKGESEGQNHDEEQEKNEWKSSLNEKAFFYLSDQAIDKTVAELKRYYVAGHRHNFSLHLSGFACHSGLAEESALKIVAKLAEHDEELDSRLESVRTTYAKGLDGEEITGRPTLAELIINITNFEPDIIHEKLESLQLAWYQEISGSNQKTAGKSTTENEETAVISVSDALMLTEGQTRVLGKIMMCSSKFKTISATQYKCNNEDCRYRDLIKHTRNYITTSDKNDASNKCPRCNKTTLAAKHQFNTAIQIELQDTNNLNEVDRLVAYLFGNNTRSLKIGETVVIEGKIYVINKNDNRRNKFISVLYGDTIFYQDRQELLLTEDDEKNIQSLYNLHSNDGRNNDGWIDFLVSQFAPRVARNYYPKLGILLSAASSGPDEIFKTRDRIHSLLAGEPGLAKSIMLEDATKLVPNSRYMSMSNTSGISLTVMVEKDEFGGGYNIRMGSIPLAKNGIFAANEINELNFKNQLYLGDIMEEGLANISKYTIDADIVAPVTMISACNPTGTWWKSNENVSLDEIGIPLKEIDRYDLIFIVRMTRVKEDLEAFDDDMTKCEKENPNPTDYMLLQKIILRSKRFRPKLDKEAIQAIKTAWIEFAMKRGSVRIRSNLYRLTKMFARLKFKSIADIEDANNAISLYKFIDAQFETGIVQPKNPRHVVVDAFREVLIKYPDTVFTSEDLQAATSNNRQVQAFLFEKTTSSQPKHNHRLRDVIDQLRDSIGVMTTSSYPLSFKWVGKTAEKKPENKAEKQYTSNSNESDQSDQSDNTSRQDVNERNNDKEPTNPTETDSSKNNQSSPSNVENIINNDGSGDPPKEATNINLNTLGEDPQSLSSLSSLSSPLSPKIEVLNELDNPSEFKLEHSSRSRISYNYDDENEGTD